jgi:molybdopterin-guanine dinucleotide biosynthesis protein A
VDIVVPIVNGYYEPLCAAYRRTAIPVIQETLDRGALKITEIYDRLYLTKVSEPDIRRFDPELSSFANLNTPKQLRLLAQL